MGGAVTAGLLEGAVDTGTAEDEDSMEENSTGVEAGAVEEDDVTGDETAKVAVEDTAAP